MKCISAKQEYPYDSTCYTLVINNEKFRDEQGNLIKEMTRDGTNHDVKKIDEVFGKKKSKVIREDDVNSKVCNISRFGKSLFLLMLKGAACTFERGI